MLLKNQIRKRGVEAHPGLAFLCAVPTCGLTHSQRIPHASLCQHCLRPGDVVHKQMWSLLSWC